MMKHNYESALQTLETFIVNAEHTEYRTELRVWRLRANRRPCTNNVP